MNEWFFSGKIVYEKDINNTFQSVKLIGIRFGVRI